MRDIWFRTFLQTLTESLGPGGNTSQRVSDHILNAAGAKDFTLEKVFLGVPAWIDFGYLY